MITAESLIRSSLQPQFNLGAYSWTSQNPDILSAKVRNYVVPTYLPAMQLLWHDIESVTGFKWKCTSYLRDSPSHSKGQSFDLAPDIAPSARSNYAVYRGSDPVLYKRQELVNRLQKLKNRVYSPYFSFGIFLEPDHLHIQVLSNKGNSHPVSINKWQIAKPIYADTFSRMKLPVTATGY